MNVVLSLLPGPEPGAPRVGDIRKIQIFIDEKLGGTGDGWEVQAPPSTLWLQAGGVTVSVFSVRALPVDGNATKLEAEVMIHQPGPLVVGPIVLLNQVTKSSVEVPLTTITGAEIRSSPPPPQEPPWLLPALPFGGWNWLLIGGIGTVLLLALLALGVFARKRLRDHLTRKLTNTERALHALANLQKYMRPGKPLSLDEWKKFSFELAGILRRYSDGNFGMSSADMTDREFLAELRSRTGAAAFVHLIAQILGRITEVRYGRKELDASVVPSLLLEAKKFVESTSVEPETKQEAR